MIHFCTVKYRNQILQRGINRPAWQPGRKTENGMHKPPCLQTRRFFSFIMTFAINLNCQQAACSSTNTLAMGASVSWLSPGAVTTW